MYFTNTDQIIIQNNIFFEFHLKEKEEWTTKFTENKLVVNYDRPKSNVLDFDYKTVQTIDLTTLTMRIIGIHEILAKNITSFFDLPQCSIYYNGNDQINIMGKALKSILTQSCTIIENNIDYLTSYSTLEMLMNYTEHYKMRLRKYISRGFAVYYHDKLSDESDNITKVVEVTEFNIDKICDSIRDELYERKMWQFGFI